VDTSAGCQRVQLGPTNRHLVWDWNGTLFNDLNDVVAATNSTLQWMGHPAITSARYRELYCRPVKTFHEKLIGHAISQPMWDVINAQFLAAYASNRRSAALAHDALICLAEARRLGMSQSLLSMMWHEQLLGDVAHYGVTAFFSVVDGDRDGKGETKASLLSRHLAAQRIAPRFVIVIGDTVDDALAAQAVGARCILVTANAAQSAATLKAFAPTVRTLTDALGIVRSSDGV